MSEKERAIRALRLFNEKADKLLASTFAKKMLDGQSGVTLSVSYETGEEVSNFERTGPNEENIESFVLNYRFFIQNNERSSFKNMKDLYSSALLSAKFESRFDSARDALNDFLDSPSQYFPINYNGEDLTRRTIIDTFIYGGFAHANEEKENLFKEWQSIPPFFPIIENEFVYALTSILNVIAFIRNLNLEALKELEAN